MYQQLMFKKLCRFLKDNIHPQNIHFCVLSKKRNQTTENKKNDKNAKKRG